MFGNWAAVHSWAAVSAALITPPPPPHPREFSSIPRGAQPLLHVCMYVSACERICCTSPSTCKTTGEVKVHLADAVKMLCHASLFTFFLFMCSDCSLFAESCFQPRCILPLTALYLHRPSIPFAGYLWERRPEGAFPGNKNSPGCVFSLREMVE